MLGCTTFLLLTGESLFSPEAKDDSDHLACIKSLTGETFDSTSWKGLSRFDEFFLQSGKQPCHRQIVSPTLTMRRSTQKWSYRWKACPGRAFGLSILLICQRRETSGRVHWVLFDSGPRQASVGRGTYGSRLAISWIRMFMWSLYAMKINLLGKRNCIFTIIFLLMQISCILMRELPQDPMQRTVGIRIINSIHTLHTQGHSSSSVRVHLYRI